MTKLWIIGLAGILLAGCVVAPSAENILTNLEDTKMEKTILNPTPESSSAEESAPVEKGLPGELLFDFEPGSETWYSVDDNVMGGVSSSAGQILDEGTLLFSGTMSLENNGGFSSIRSPWNPIDLTGKDGLLIRVLGDGSIYRLRIRSSATGSEVAYNSFFETEDGEWTSVYIPFQTMVPSLRGFQVQSGELDPATVTSLGFMLSDKQPGEFSLQVDWIRAVAEEEILPEGLPEEQG